MTRQGSRGSRVTPLLQSNMSSAWDDDDDVPLASMVRAGAGSTPSTPSPAKQPKAQGKEGKRESEARQRRTAQKPVDLDEILKPNISPAPRARRTLPEYVRANLGSIVAGTLVLLLIYGALVSDGMNFHTDESADRIDPYKALGLPRSASDKEIKAAYRKLSMELHPDKNPDQTELDAERFKEITQGYKILSDPQKKKRWLNHENPDEKGIPSDTLTLTDQTAGEINKGTWLLLAYADWSSECWELAETWETVAKHLARTHL